MNGAAAPPAPDLRLAGFAVATWLSALVVLHATASGGVLLSAGAAAIAAVVASARILRGWPGRSRWIVVAVLLGVLCGGLATAARVAGRDAAPLAELVAAGATIRAEVVVTEDPRAVRGSPGRPSAYLVPVDVRTVWPDGHDGSVLRISVRALVLATDPAWRTLLPGQRATTSGRLLEPRGGDLRAAVLSVRQPPELSGTPGWAQRAAGALRAGLQRACEPLPDEPGGLLPGLVVGDTSRLDPAVEADFRTTGMTHLNAVSGANVALVLGAVLLLVRWTRVGPVATAAVCAAALVGFVILARPSPSVVRAGAMGAVGLLALASGRPRAAMPALAAAVALLILVDPELAGDAGFTLSVLATGGLLLLAPRWRDGLRRRGVPAGIAEALAVPAAAQLACAPVVAGLSGTISLVAVPANLVAVPAIAPATLLGVLAALLSPLWPAAAEVLAWLGGWPAWWLVVVARYGAQVPAGAVPWPDGVSGALLLTAITGALLLGARRAQVRRLVAVLAAGAVLGALPVRLLASGWPPAGWVAVACDVGQGDAVVLPAGGASAVVIDAGGDPTAVDRCLRRLGVRRVPVFALSHFHVDHVGGLAGVLRGREVGQVVVPALPEPAAGRRLVVELAARARIPVRVVPAGWRFQAAGLTVTVLGPAEHLAGTRSDPNNNSLVMRAHLPGLTVLLAGDAEGEEQRSLLDRYGTAGLRADVLKVAHHGSAYQDEAFLEAVDPAVAMVSVGADNDYGHPNQSLLARLHRGGARVLRTDVGGDLAAVNAGGGLAVAARGAEPAG